ncbi:MAG: hypothetical protein HKN87_16830 [Saprospiraceae bacterium]|nr:hypothetical protein [Saprospiraceae bacterium]
MKKLAVIILAIGLLSSACNNQNESKLEDVADDVAHVTEEMGDDIQQEMRAMKANLQQAKSKVEKEIKKIDAKMETASADMKADLEERKAELQDWSNKIGLKMQKLVDIMVKDWQAFKEDGKEFFDDFDDALRDDA